MRRNHHQRGVMAVLSALSALILTSFLVVVLEAMFMVRAKRELTNATDALATAYGDKMVLAPVQPTFNPSTLDVTAVITANAVPELSATPLVSTPYTYRRISGPSDQTDAFSPLFVNVSTQAPPLPAGINALVPRLLGGALPAVRVSSAARVNQINLATPTIIRERVELLIDFSASMRLPYQGINAKSNESAAAVARRAALSLINFYAQDLFDLGIDLFGDGTPSHDARQDPIGKSVSDPVALNAHLERMRGMVQTQSTYESDTDMASAISNAVGAMNAPGVSTNPLFSTQRIILVSDGQPDAGGGININAPLADRTRAAGIRTTSVMQAAWESGVISDVFFMQHLNQSDDERDEAVGFMKGVAGGLVNNKPTFVSKNYSDDGGDPTQLENFLSSLPLLPYCYFKTLPTLDPPVPAHLLPRSGDQLYGYFADSWDPRSGHEYQIPAKNVFIDDATGFRNWTLMQNASRSTTTFNLTPGWYNDASRLAFFYDSANKQVYLSSWMCLAFLSNQNSNKNTMRFRMRWAAPHLVDPNSPVPF